MKALLLVPLLFAQAQVQVRREAYKGWNEVVVVEAAKPGVSLTAVPALGGRLIRYGANGANILFENPDYLGKTLENSDPARLAQGYIGYNIDLGPEIRGLPKHLALWVGKYEAADVDAGVVLKSAVDPGVGIEIEKQVEMDPLDGSLRLRQRMTNRGDKDASYCLWDRTLCEGGGFALIPLNPASKFPSGWSQLKDGKYVSDKPAHDAVQVLDGVLVAKAGGPSSKLGADSDGGWIAYAKGRQLFVKYFPYDAAGKYSDGGNSVELYFDPKVCELEPLSPEVTLAPGRAYEFMERWLLLPLERDVTTAEEARALVKLIPAHPFKKR